MSDTNNDALTIDHVKCLFVSCLVCNCFNFPQCVWGVNRADEVFVRIGLSADDPKGKEWTKIEGSMKSIR